MVIVPKFYALYIENEQNAGPKNDRAMRKYPRQFVLVKVLALILCKVDLPKLYKIESAAESEKWCLNGWLYNMVFLTKFLRHYIQTELIADPKSDHFMRASCYHFPFVCQIV
jgi:hypothetical protein